jgi:hypothetical protein
MPTREQVRELTDKVTKELVDQGKLVEAGWVGLRAAAIPADASETQLDEMRMAFFAGAQHLWGSINSFLESGEEPTAKDMRRMSAIDKELTQFIAALKLRMSKR